MIELGDLNLEIVIEKIIQDLDRQSPLYHCLTGEELYTYNEKLEGCIDYFYFGKLDLCGCGRIDTAYGALRFILNSVYNEINIDNNKIPKNAYNFICDYLIHRKMLKYDAQSDKIEITDEGTMLLYLYNTYIEEEGLEYYV